MSLIETIKLNWESVEGSLFPTPDYMTMQVGIRKGNKGEKTKPHYHPTFDNGIKPMELFIVTKGNLLVHLYHKSGIWFNTEEVGKGEMLLVSSPHSLEFPEDAEIIEVKQGPYRGKGDKIWLKQQ